MRWPRSLLARNALLIVALVLGGQIISIASHLALVQAPRAAQLAELTARYVAMLEQALSAAPASERAKIVREQGGNVLRFGETQPPEQAIDNWLDRAFAAHVKALMPERRVVFVRGPEQAFWIEARVGKETLWLVTETRGLIAANVRTWLMVSAVGVAIGLVGALMISLRINRPLRDLGAAAGRVGAGAAAPVLPEKGPTELAAVAQAFNRMVRDLEALDKDRALMLAGISHDLRTPLTRVRIALEILAREPDPKLVRQAADNIERVDRTLGQFLAYAEDETIERARYADVAQIIAEAVEEHARAGADIAFEPSPLPNLNVRSLALVRAVDNLIGNALRHGRPPVTVRADMVDHGVLITVSDRGDGIPPEDVTRLIQPFQQSRANRGRSAGLGLAITDRIARLHSGSLTFRRAAAGTFEARMMVRAAIRANIADGPVEPASAQEI